MDGAVSSDSVSCAALDTMAVAIISVATSVPGDSGSITAAIGIKGRAITDKSMERLIVVERTMYLGINGPIISYRERKEPVTTGWIDQNMMKYNVFMVSIYIIDRIGVNLLTVCRAFRTCRGTQCKCGSLYR